MKLAKSPKGLKVVELVKNVPSEGVIADLYDTRIIEYNPGRVRFNSGGWRTMHTKKCMNLVLQALGLDVQVVQRKGTWYVVAQGQTFEFQDGYILNLEALHGQAS